MSSSGAFIRRGPAALLVAGLLAATAAAGGISRPASADPPARVTEVSSDVGSATALQGFDIQSSADVSDSPETISTPGYEPSGWFPAGPRSTVMAALVAHGKYPDPFYSTNMQQDDKPFKVPWWYRSDFTVTDTSARTFLDITGILSAADVYVNGKLIAGADEVEGAYPRYERDITAAVKSGANTVAFRVQPNDPDKHLTMGWIDWNPSPADKLMGMTSDIVIRRTGAVALDDVHVVTTVDPSLASADLTVKAKVHNHSGEALTTTVSGAVGEVGFSKEVTLAAGETKPVEFTPADTSQLKFTEPRIWWPAGQGEHPLYDLTMTAKTNAAVTDTARKQFGIRDIQSKINEFGGREYIVNGKRTLIRGATEAPDILMRWNAQEAADRFAYAFNMGINAIRLEGHLEPDEFYTMADRSGMLLLPGWECCNRWMERSGDNKIPDKPYSAREREIAKNSMATVAADLRNHPSVITFFIGSDEAPLEETGQAYRAAIEAADFQVPIVSDINGNSSGGYASGMKMSSPYDWVPPVYWYTKKHGGAFGFNAETSCGAAIPTLDTLRRMLSADELEDLWQHPETAKYHRSHADAFSNLKIFGEALDNRYGKPTSLEDFVRKAHLSQYESARAQFESYARNFTDPDNPSTGQVFWMLNSPWTSLHWQMFDRYFDQEGTYFGAQKSNEELHIQYSYDDRSVVVINQRTDAATGLTAHVDLYDLDGDLEFHQDAPVASTPGYGGKAVALTVPEKVDNLSTTYLAKLTLTDADNREISRNVYWLSTEPDVVEYGGKNFPYSPTKSFGSMKGLNDMAKAQVSATASSSSANGQTTVTVTLTNTDTGNTPALQTDVRLVDAQNKPILPATWSNNQVGLWPGESVTITATVRTDVLAGATPKLRISGWNLDTTTADVSAS
ncbi:glycoside hydrolase family 2 protein [Nocardia sp. NPDC004722]